MFTDYKYIEYLRRVLSDNNQNYSNFKNEHTNIDIYYTFSNNDRQRKLSNFKRHNYLDIRIYYSSFFQLLIIKCIKSHQKQSVSLMHVLHYLMPDLSLDEIKNIIIATIIGKNLPENINIIIPDSLIENTLETIISVEKNPKKKYFNNYK